MSSPSILSKNIEDKSSTTEIAPPQHNQLLPLQPRQDVQNIYWMFYMSITKDKM